MSVRYRPHVLVAFLVIFSIFVRNAESQTSHRNLKDYKQGPSLDLKDEYLDTKKTELRSPQRDSFYGSCGKAAPKAI